MNKAVTTADIERTEAVLESFLQDVEDGDIQLDGPTMVVGFVENFSQTEPDSEREVIIKPIGSISGDPAHAVVIYETIVMPRVSFGIFDQSRKACITVSIDVALKWMTPTGGEDIVERDLLEGMRNNIKRFRK